MALSVVFPAISWPPDAHQIQLLRDEIHVWQRDWQVSGLSLEEQRLLLSCDEQQRADRFIHPQHRQNFIIARSGLRLLLAAYLQVAPTDVQFAYTSKGKPQVANYPNLIFNLSHACDCVLYALSRNLAIGVDLEHLRSIDQVEQLAERFFSRSEAQFLHALPAEQRSHAFLHTWVCREAYLKATGEGLAGLETISVQWPTEVFWPGPISHHSRPTLQKASGLPFAQPWAVEIFYPQQDNVAAIAIPQERYQIRWMGRF